MAKIVITIQDRDDQSAEVSWTHEGEGQITDLKTAAQIAAFEAIGLLFEAKMEQEQLEFDFSNLDEVD